MTSITEEVALLRRAETALKIPHRSERLLTIADVHRGDDRDRAVATVGLWAQNGRLIYAPDVVVIDALLSASAAGPPPADTPLPAPAFGAIFVSPAAADLSKPQLRASLIIADGRSAVVGVVRCDELQNWEQTGDRPDAPILIETSEDDRTSWDAPGANGLTNYNAMLWLAYMLAHPELVHSRHRETKQRGMSARQRARCPSLYTISANLSTLQVQAPAPSVSASGGGGSHASPRLHLVRRHAHTYLVGKGREKVEIRTVGPFWRGVGDSDAPAVTRIRKGG